MAINSINGKVYIGQTSLTLKERMGDHRRKSMIHRSKSHFHAAIRKYGFDAFDWNILERFLFREVLNTRERFWIKRYHSDDPKRGYNNTKGGDSFEFTEEARKRIGDGGRGIKRSEDFKQHLREISSGNGNPFYGKHHSEESRKKNSDAHRGKVPWNKGRKTGKAPWNKGKRYVITRLSK